ncbi:hypothetical protein [Dialister invisus]
MEIMEELDTEIVVGDLIDTIEYDYPDFPPFHGLLLVRDRERRSCTERA